MAWGRQGRQMDRRSLPSTKNNVLYYLNSLNFTGIHTGKAQMRLTCSVLRLRFYICVDTEGGVLDAWRQQLLMKQLAPNSRHFSEAMTHTVTTATWAWCHVMIGDSANRNSRSSVNREQRSSSPNVGQGDIWCMEHRRPCRPGWVELTRPVVHTKACRGHQVDSSGTTASEKAVVTRNHSIDGNGYTQYITITQKKIKTNKKQYMKWGQNQKAYIMEWK